MSGLEETYTNVNAPKTVNCAWLQTVTGICTHVPLLEQKLFSNKYC